MKKKRKEKKMKQEIIILTQILYKQRVLQLLLYCVHVDALVIEDSVILNINGSYITFKKENRNLKER